MKLKSHIKDLTFFLTSKFPQIKEFLKVILYQTIFRSKNIHLQLQILSTSNTAKYINNNLIEISPVKNKFDVLDIALKNITLEDGEIMEFGIYKGGTINYIAKKNKNKIIYGFDSFEGLPEDWRYGFSKGKFTLDKQIPKLERNIKIYTDLFENSIPKFIEDKKNKLGLISFIHIDCDLYSSTKLIFSLLKNQIGRGTVIVFDEYFNYPGWEKGEFLAFKEFILSKKLKYKYLTYNCLHEQVAIKIL